MTPYGDVPRALLAPHLDECIRPTCVRPASDLRAGSLPDVQLVGGAGPYEVDVLVRVLPEDQVEIVGQVTGAGRLHEPVCALTVGLFDAGALECVGRATTDPFGEFVLQRVRSARYVLAFGSGSDAPCMAVWEGEKHAEACPTPV
jgi:hypothetical protein